MFELRIDDKRCTDCNTCDVLLPGFRSVRLGKLMISHSSMEKEEVVKAVNAVIEGCANKAIELEKL